MTGPPLPRRIPGEHLYPTHADTTNVSWFGGGETGARSRDDATPAPAPAWPTQDADEAAYLRFLGQHGLSAGVDAIGLYERVLAGLHRVDTEHPGSVDPGTAGLCARDLPREGA